MNAWISCGEKKEYSAVKNTGSRMSSATSVSSVRETMCAFRLRCLRRYAFASPRTERERVLRHIGLHGLSFSPFPHSKEYFRLPPCQVSHDPANGLPYVMHNGNASTSKPV